MAEVFDFVEAPIPLITVGSDQKLEVNAQALNILTQIEKPIAVVGVAGMYRTGKSYLLNRVILNRNSGFGVGPTINPCTKGIWMWGKPLKGQTVDGEIVNVIVLDSEGLAAVDQDNSHDSRIFSLVMLLSSVFIYNSVGSIDEQALENLSLVINLTKNIHIKSSGNDELDFEDFAYYMPYFLWVVRDFSLELVDTDGDAINSRQYLEGALQDQKGFSEQTEQKNHIRHLLRSFFKERNCYTMVRPVTDEKNLRQLEHADPDILRPEFVEQVMDLRKQVLSQAKKKLLNDSELNGPMLVGLIQNYIRAINSNDVPNIESAWSYICKAQCSKAYEESFAEYEERMKASFMQVWPISSIQLKCLHKEYAEVAAKHYKRKAVGDAVDEYFVALKSDIKERYNWSKSENARDFEHILLGEMNTYFTQKIDVKLKAKQYTNFIDFERDLKALEHYFGETEPQGPHKAQIIADFMQKKMTECIYVFIHSLENDYEAQITRNKERKAEVDDELKTLKDRTAREKGTYDSRISELENLNRQLESRIELLSDSLERVKKEKSQIEETYKIQLADESLRSKETLNKLNADNATLRDNLQGLERDLALKESEFDKQTALLQQKVIFYEDRLNSLDNKEEAHSSEISRIRTELTDKFKDTNAALEAELVTKNKEFHNASERLLDLEEEIENLTKRERENTKTALQRENKLKEELTRKTEKLEELEVRLQDNTGVSNAEVDEFNKQIENLKESLEAEQKDCKAAEERITQIKTNFEKEKALLKQNNEFLEEKANSLKEQLENSKKLYEEMLKTIESNADIEKIDYNSCIEDMKEQHNKYVKSLEVQLVNNKAQLTDEINRLTDKLDEDEIRNNNEKENLRAELARHKENYDNAERDRLQLKRELQQLEEHQDDYERKMEEEAADKIRDMEDKFEEIKQKYNRDAGNANKKQEESIQQMKIFYETQRDVLERKLATEKESTEKKIAKCCSEYEESIREKERNHEDALENMRNEFNEYVITSNSEFDHYKQNLFNAEAAAEELKASLDSVKAEYETLKANYDANVDGLQTALEIERKNLVDRLDRVGTESVAKDKQIWEITQKLESSSVELIKLQEQYNLKLKPLEEESSKLRLQIDTLREKYNKLNEEYVNYKIEEGKNLALSQQQNEFFSRRLEELNKNNEGFNRRIEEKLREQRDAHVSELAAIKSRFEDDRKELEVKYESKRKSAKEAENLYTEKISSLEKEKNEFADKFSALNTKKLKDEARLLQESEQLRNRLDEVTSKTEVLTSTLQKQVEVLKENNYKLEMEVAQTRANLEKDTALWEGKFSFQEDQKEQLKIELKHVKHNFDLMLLKVQNLQNSDKENIANDKNMIRANMEIQYAELQKEIEEKHLQQLQALNERNSKLERECKNISDRSHEEKNSMLVLIANSDRKAAEATESERMLQEQIVKIKKDNKSKQQETQRKFEDTISGLRTRLSEAEDKFNEVERLRAAATFEQDRLKTKFSTEKESLSSQKDELVQQVAKLEASKDALLRDNEKLRNEQKANRRLLGNNMSSAFQPNRFNTLLGSSRLNDRSMIGNEPRQPSPINGIKGRNDTNSKISFAENNSSNNSNLDVKP